MTGYDAVKKTTGVADRSGEARFRVTGPDRITWLQGLLTNDIAALTPGTGCYAAYLTPQGRMLADVRVLHLGEELILDVPPVSRVAVFERLTSFIIMEDVVLEDVTDTVARVALHGPQARDVLSTCVGADAADAQSRSLPRQPGTPRWGPGLAELARLPEYASVRASFGQRPTDLIVAGSRELGALGFDLYCPTAAKPDLLAALHAAGAAAIDEEAWHTLRIEAGRPQFGVDMTLDTIPLEAGIEDRAISFTKGCYVGQEIIIRIMHRGHGRVARKLVGLQVESPSGVGGRSGGLEREHSAPIAIVPGAPIYAGCSGSPGDREIGHVTSATYSPGLAHFIAMGYVHRDFTDPNTGVAIGASEPRVAAKVVTLPFVPVVS
jgi:folate-binding protein YgfZ